MLTKLASQALQTPVNYFIKLSMHRIFERMMRKIKVIARRRSRSYRRGSAGWSRATARRSCSGSGGRRGGGRGCPPSGNPPGKPRTPPSPPPPTPTCSSWTSSPSKLLSVEYSRPPMAPRRLRRHCCRRCIRDLKSYNWILSSPHCDACCCTRIRNK